MPARTCPKCKQKGRHLAAISEDCVVEYYRCDHCGHVWTVDALGVRRDVTVPMPSRQNSGTKRGA
jgi:transposase-like protein